eukprot:4139408-Prymnesium_polylepis.1
MMRRVVDGGGRGVRGGADGLSDSAVRARTGREQSLRLGVGPDARRLCGDRAEGLSGPAR